MNTLLAYVQQINALVAYPVTIIFICVGIYLTCVTRCMQVRGLGYLRSILANASTTSSQGGMGALGALFTALATTLGTGNIIGPSMAIAAGGPGALLWLACYAFFGGIMRYAEVTFAITTRTINDDKTIVGGPIKYLSSIGTRFAAVYGICMVLLFTVWSALQANTFASIATCVGVTPTLSAIFLIACVIAILAGGTRYLSLISQNVVPLMCGLYLIFALTILGSNIGALGRAIHLIFTEALSFQAPLGAAAGIAFFRSVQAGIYKSTLITEAGIGTSALPHAVAQTEHPTYQGMLAMYSIIADTALSLLSGLVILVTGVWSMPGLDNAHIYQAFTQNTPFPHVGSFILLVSITLFVVTTIMGNMFNGVQSLRALLPHRRVSAVYYSVVSCALYAGAFTSVPLMWACTDIVLVAAALSNLLGLVVLTQRSPTTLAAPPRLSGSSQQI